jgi:hypothetical protein
VHTAANPIHCGDCVADVAWLTVNAGEAIPGVVTPLTWSFFAGPMERGTRGAFCDLGVLREAEVERPPESEFVRQPYGLSDADP